MDIKQLFRDEDAVSPVIGVILMVAVTVILAAVIGTFVLGLGDQVQSSAPNANFQFEYGGDWTSPGSNNPTATVIHNGGQDVEAANLRVQFGGTTAWDSDNPTGTNDFSTSASDTDWYDGSNTQTIATGAQHELEYTGSTNFSGDTLRVIWESPNGDSSNTIGSSTVPA